MREASYYFDFPSSKTASTPLNELGNQEHRSPKQNQREGIITVTGLDKKEGDVFQHQLASVGVRNSESLAKSHPKVDSLSLHSTAYTYVDNFFFENDDFQMKKIDGVRMSLCMAIRILYKLTSAKKKQNCELMLENDLSSELFKYFSPYIEHQDDTPIKQIR
mmetsp:Transcript_14442/g.14051  ORF Transcript_14442/g.14051 Transcript_14442/m.14051 type:complete len:162 (+) Transcript_14442:217-702(+)